MSTSSTYTKQKCKPRSTCGPCQRSERGNQHLSMGFSMSATMNTHREVRRSPRSMVMERVPQVAIEVPLAAWRVKLLLGRLRSAWVAGTTLTSAPVFTKKRRP